MRSAREIEFDLPSWDEITADEISPEECVLKAWVDGSGGLATLHHFELEPELVAPLTDMPAIRDQYRRMVSGCNGALVEIESEVVGGLGALKAILKFQQDPSGMTYVGSYTFPFASRSYVIRVACPEAGMTGMRDTGVALKVGAATEDGIASGWFSDPYDPGHEASVLRSRSDDQEWDELFADHPLTRVRRTLQQISKSCQVVEHLKQLKPYSGPSAAG